MDASIDIASLEKIYEHFKRFEFSAKKNVESLEKDRKQILEKVKDEMENQHKKKEEALHTYLQVKNEVADLRQQLSFYENEQTSLQNQISYLDNQYSNLKIQLENLRVQKSSLESYLNSSQDDEKNAILSQLQSVNRKMDQTESERRKTLNELSDTKIKLRHNEEQLERINGDLLQKEYALEQAKKHLDKETDKESKMKDAKEKVDEYFEKLEEALDEFSRTVLTTTTQSISKLDACKNAIFAYLNTTL